MKLRTYTKKQVKSGMRILMRIDADVSLLRGRVDPLGSLRLDRVIPELKMLRKHGARIVLMGHLGRPGGKMDAALSMKPIANYLSYHLSTKVRLAPDIIGPDTKRLTSDMKDGDIVLLENVRFDEREKKNQKGFARMLASYGDLYVNNALAMVHRKHASVLAVTEFLPSIAGSALAEEVKALSKKITSPSVLIVGGIKLPSKEKAILSLGPKVDKILTVGGVGVALMGAALGKSFNAGEYRITDADRSMAMRLLNTFGDKIRLPVDGGLASSVSFRKLTYPLVSDWKEHDMIFDIGPETIAEYENIIEGAKTIIWNGPAGLFEKKASLSGSKKLGMLIARQKKARTIIGGGNTLALIRSLKLEKKYSYVSTGGGAMLSLLGGEALPVLETLKR
jgi:phosphoglycerate kinase